MKLKISNIARCNIVLFTTIMEQEDLIDKGEFLNGFEFVTFDFTIGGEHESLDAFDFAEVLDSLIFNNFKVEVLK